jgi:hypothetical protein
MNRAANGVQQMRPRLQGLCRYAAAAGLRLAGWTAVEERHSCALARQQFSGKRSGGTGAYNQQVKIAHEIIVTVCPSALE